MNYLFYMFFAVPFILFAGMQYIGIKKFNHLLLKYFPLIVSLIILAFCIIVYFYSDHQESIGYYSQSVLVENLEFLKFSLIPVFGAISGSLIGIAVYRAKTMISY